MPDKIRYEIDLTKTIPAVQSGEFRVRPVSTGDLDGLARLMLDAYVGTIDYEDESLEDAVGEVRSFFDGAPLLDRSFVVEEEERLASAVLVSLFEGEPFIGYVMTIPSRKGQGLASLVTTRALDLLSGDGHDRVVLYITEGNAPSEALFASLGAVRAGG